MPRKLWDETDPAVQARIRDNLEDLFEAVEASAVGGEAPSVESARAWHRATLEGVPVHLPEAIGTFRGEGQPGSVMRTYPVAIGGIGAVPAGEVAAELARFEDELVRRVGVLDGKPPGKPQLVGEALELAAWAHGEWVRIHPFGDGNGRTARIWANWILVRYGLPPAVRLRPRPTGQAILVGGRQTNRYKEASVLSMSGNHRLMQRFVTRAVEDALDE